MLANAFTWFVVACVELVFIIICAIRSFGLKNDLEYRLRNAEETLQRRQEERDELRTEYFRLKTENSVIKDTYDFIQKRMKELR